MTVVTKSLQIGSMGENDVVDLTREVSAALKGTGLTSGVVTLFVPGSTGAVTTWRLGHLTNARVLAMLFGFVLLTAGLWLAQDAMNASLILGRDYVDLPFFSGRMNLYQTKDCVDLLICLGYLSCFSLTRIAVAGGAAGEPRSSTSRTT